MTLIFWTQSAHFRLDLPSGFGLGQTVFEMMIIFWLFLSVYYFLQWPTVSESEAVRGISSSAVLHRKLGIFHPGLLEEYTELTEQHLLVGGFTVHISSISLENTNRVPAGHPRLTPIKQLNHPNHLLHSVWSS